MSASTPEGLVKRQIKQILMTYKAYVCMPATGGYGSSGHPDFLACIKGRMIGIEAKAGNGVPTALQLNRLREIVEAGGVAIVVNETNLDDLRIILSLIYNIENTLPAYLLKPVLPPTMKVKA
jgi:hypothetical protein